MCLAVQALRKTVTEVLLGKHVSERKLHCSTLKAYKEMSVFIPVDIMEYVVKLIMQKLSRGTGPGGTDSEALQGWPLKFGDHSKKLHISVEYFVAWIANRSLARAASWVFMSGRLIALDKQPAVH